MTRLSALLTLVAACLIAVSASAVNVCSYSVSHATGFLCPSNGTRICMSVSALTGTCDAPLRCFGGPGIFCGLSLTPKSGPMPQCPFSSRRLGSGFRCARERVVQTCRAGNLQPGGPGVDLFNPTTLLSALPLVNPGSAPAQNVQITSIALPGATLTVPPALPFHLGTIPSEGAAILNADFTGAFAPLGSYPLVVAGTYTARGVPFCFTVHATLTIPPGAPGSAPLRTVTVDPNHIDGAPFPPRLPDFDEEVNPPRWTVPTAPFVPGPPPPNSTGAEPAPFGDPPAIVFDANNGMGLTSGGVNGTVGTTAEPSGASGGGVVFATANWLAAYSMDGGGSFTELDPTTIFPADVVGFCCDQIVQYVPSIDRFIWLLQGNGFRLATASPADIISSGGTAWTYWNLPPTLFDAAGACSDYPDLSVGDNALYMSWDTCACTTPPVGCRSGLQVSRTSLAGLAAGGTITIDYTDPPDPSVAWGSHVSQDTGDEVFWAGHNTNSEMRVFSPGGGVGHVLLAQRRRLDVAEEQRTHVVHAGWTGLAGEKLQRTDGQLVSLQRRDRRDALRRSGLVRVDRRHRRPIPASAHRARDPRPRQ